MRWGFDMKYSTEAINGVLTLLNNIEIKGIDNAKRIAGIATILQNPEEDKDGGKDEEVCQHDS